MNDYRNRPSYPAGSRDVGNLGGAALIALIVAGALVYAGLGWVVIPLGLILLIVGCMT
ncbi:hypothetical protein [Bradyrhizobium sp. SZCCHNRI1073]|uniref:hypothetical protein n=1 Tax=Bradyrhizobium sp. SZCCHNRI1073 TaxID=3057280 RepID=UPI0029168E25|nr:hypothetical protein [Bradyrhizobium sp. SZCCHNRI1073]